MNRLCFCSSDYQIRLHLEQNCFHYSRNHIVNGRKLVPSTWYNLGRIQFSVEISNFGNLMFSSVDVVISTSRQQSRENDERRAVAYTESCPYTAVD